MPCGASLSSNIKILGLIAFAIIGRSSCQSQVKSKSELDGSMEKAMLALKPAIDHRLGVAIMSEKGKYLVVGSEATRFPLLAAANDKLSSDSQFYLERVGQGKIAIFDAERRLYLGRSVFSVV